jgi:hypothetical protein
MEIRTGVSGTTIAIRLPLSTEQASSSGAVA